MDYYKSPAVAAVVGGPHSPPEHLQEVLALFEGQQISVLHQLKVGRETPSCMCGCVWTESREPCAVFEVAGIFRDCFFVRLIGALSTVF